MNNDYLSQISELEQEFSQELRGYGSLSLNLRGASADERDYLGYDIRPEDVEAIYFEGIGIPRWETIKADTVDQQVALYNESMQKIMADYPLIGRVSDTDQRVEYTPDEVSELRQECEKILENTSNPQAVKALQKLAIACLKAAEHQKGLLLLPS
ncbi:MAG TPA: hypothetical protein VNB22_00455 [Pyrinomonadaceae bacterium]|nr:hypothetical protein [Pyrinomonadaceae bacterium]